MSGYLHPGYAQTLAEFGAPIELPQSGGWILKRAIPGTPFFDGMGCYPYLVCRDWAKLAADLAEIGEDLVSFAAVTDPFGDYAITDLQAAFPDVLHHFKDHYIADLSQPLESFVSKHHQREAEKALRKLDVEFYPDPLPLLEEWMVLFTRTVERFGLTGIPAFSRQSFAQQFALPGSSLSLARRGEKIVALHSQLRHGDAAYAHTAGEAPEARTAGAAFALYHREIEYFSDKVRWLDWGGEAGLAKRGNLSTFKKGWSNATRPVFFGGRILNRDRYEKLARVPNTSNNRYFPIYRHGEFR